MRHTAILLLYTVVAVCLFSLSAKAQEPRREETTELLLRHIDDDEERERVAEVLQTLLDHPLDLNKASSEELSTIPFFDAFFVRNLLLERSRRGGFRSVYDLKQISGAPILYLPLLEPFLTVSPMDEGQRPIPRRGRLHIGTGTDLSKGIKFTDRLAPMIHFESLSERSWSAYLVAERDRGEPAQPLHRGLFDHLSFTLTKAWTGHTDNALDHSLLIGDFRVNTGQGLVMGMSRSYFSHLESRMGTPSFVRSPLRPHHSAREYGFLRGVAGRLSMSETLSLNLFCGYEALDAHVEGRQVLTLYRTGMHRTPSEQKHRNTARREVVGSYLSLDREAFHLGLLGVAHRYRGEEGTLIRHNPSGRQEPALTTALDWRVQAGDLLLWGESSLPIRQALATTAGFSLYDDYWGRWTLAGRYLGKDYATPYASPESRYSNARNEKALSATWHGEVGRGLLGTLYAEYYRSLVPDPRRRSEQGRLFSARLDYRHRDFMAIVRWRSHLTDEDQRHSLRMTLDRTMSSGWTIRFGGQLSFRHLSALSKAVSLRLRYAQEKLQCEGGLHLFDTRDLPLRADAAYMPYSYYIPMLRGAGLRLITKVRLSLSPRTLLHLRYTPTLYFHRPTTPLSPLLDLALSHRLH